MMRSPRHRNSDITVTDQFCGAGGSSIGALKAGLRVRMALNHWALAIETHNTNFPETDHDCTDVSAADPRRYPSTDILITSPECTTHSPAGGTRRSGPQRDLFKAQAEDPGLVRSRATMWDVPRFAEFHEYNAVIVENVLEVTRWALFPTWLKAMQVLGYEHRILSINSMFCHPTPQSRDRIYVVFWRQGNRAPELEFTPPAWCADCEKAVGSRQTWKNGRRWGKYRQQYLYTCPDCRREVTPFYYAALNAIDLSQPAERIGDRKRPLKPRTLERIRYGLEKYGRMALVVRTNMTTDGGRVRTVLDALHTQTASWLDALVSPPAFLVETAYSHDNHNGVHGVGEASPAQTGRQSAALVSLPFLVACANTGGDDRRQVGPADPLRTIHAGGGNHALVVPPAAVVANRAHNRPRSLADPLPVVCTGGHQMLVQGAALVTLRGTRMARGLEQPLGVQVHATQDWLLSPTPLVMAESRTGRARPISEPSPAITTVERHELIVPDEELRVEDCYFRMLQPPEIGRAMAFPDTYVVLGTKRDRVKQYGNAVTPPVMEWLIQQVLASLAPGAA